VGPSLFTSAAMASPRPLRALAALIVSLPLAAGAALAQEAVAGDPLAQIKWQQGPVTSTLASLVEVNVPASCRLTDPAGAGLFLQASSEAARGDEAGLVLCASDQPEHGHWYALLRFETKGRVADDDSGSLDATAIMDALKRQNAEDTQARKDRGEPALPLVGWVRPPVYDADAHRITWAVRYANGNPDDATVVHSVRVLGREGVLRADFIVPPTEYGAERPAFEQLMSGVSFVQGQRYADWKEGDRAAGHGLSQLIAGTSISVAQAGLLLGIWVVVRVLLFKMKAVLAKVLIAMVVGIGGLFGMLLGRRKAARA
jgi:uncharacterized membrane-anchored protein